MYNIDEVLSSSVFGEVTDELTMVSTYIISTILSHTDYGICSNGELKVSPCSALPFDPSIRVMIAILRLSNSLHYQQVEKNFYLWKVRRQDCFVCTTLT